MLVAVAAAVVAMLATSFGGGLGIRYVAKTGLTATSVFGLTLLVVGLALAGFAGVAAWRATHRWNRLWLAPMAVVWLVVTWAVALAVMFSYSPRTTLGSVTPAARGLTYTDVTFRTNDGARLSGWYVASTNRAAVVVMPGAGSTRTATLAQAAALAHRRYGVLMVDPRGQGRSGGDAMDIGWYGDRDISAAVTFLEHQPDVDPERIAVLGLSMGGEAAIGAAAADPRIRAVIAEGATGRTAADKAGWLPGGVSGTVQRGIDRLTYGVTELLSSAPQPITLYEAIERTGTTPFLLITAGTVADETSAAEHMRAAAPERVAVWDVPGASHTHGLSTQPAEWTDRVAAFLDSALGLG